MQISNYAKARIVMGLIACLMAQWLIRGLIDGWYEGKHNVRYSRASSPDDFWVLSGLLFVLTVTALYHCVATRHTWLIRALAKRERDLAEH